MILAQTLQAIHRLATVSRRIYVPLSGSRRVMSSLTSPYGATLGAGRRPDMVGQGERPPIRWCSKVVGVVGGAGVEVERPVQADGDRCHGVLAARRFQTQEVAQRAGGVELAAVGGVAGVAQRAARVEQPAASGGAAVGEHHEIGGLAGAVAERQQGLSVAGTERGDTATGAQHPAGQAGGQRGVQQRPCGVAARVDLPEGVRGTRRRPARGAARHEPGPLAAGASPVRVWPLVAAIGNFRTLKPAPVSSGERPPGLTRI